MEDQERNEEAASLTGKINSSEPANPTPVQPSRLSLPSVSLHSSLRFSRCYLAPSFYLRHPLRDSLRLRMPSISVSLAGSNPSPRTHVHTTALAYQASSNPPSTFAPSATPLLAPYPLASSIDPSSLRGNRIPRRLHEPAKQEYSPYSGTFRPNFISSRPNSPYQSFTTDFSLLLAGNETEGQG